MKRANSISISVLSQAAIVAAGLFVAGCGSHPDDQAAVYAALGKSNLSSVMVKQDRRSGVLTLSGIVNDAPSKSQAETLAEQAAPGYRVTDQIQVKPTGLQALEKKPPAAK
jgi:hypothetical protein